MQTPNGIRYKSILLKLSGEALLGDSLFGIDPKVLNRIALEVQELIEVGVQVAMVIGGGNFFRGAALESIGVNRMTGDYMGMLATVINSLAMRDALENIGLPTTLMSAISMQGLTEDFDRRQAIRAMQRGNVVLFAAGTGNPLVTTDSAASLRAIEMGVGLLIKATNVDGVYTDNPHKNPNATRYQHLTYEEALTKELGVMDLAAFCQCRDHDMKLRILNMNTHGALLRAAKGEDVGTLVERG